MKTLMHQYVKGSKRIELQFDDNHYYLFVSELRKSAKYPKTIDGLYEGVTQFYHQRALLAMEK